MSSKELGGKNWEVKNQYTQQKSYVNKLISYQQKQKSQFWIDKPMRFPTSMFKRVHSLFLQLDSLT